MFREGCAGSRIDRDQLANDILAAIHENRMDAVVEVQSHKEAPSISCDEVKASYKTLVTFTTETTDNDKRNTNVRLAAEALNGTIVQRHCCMRLLPGILFPQYAVLQQS